MFAKLIKRLPSVSPRVIIIGILIVILAATGVALLLMKSGSTADAAVEPRAARIDRIDGDVAIARVVENEQSDWAEATLNTPVTVGDRIYARTGSRASIALTGHNFVELRPDGSLDVLSLADRRTQLALRSGSALFDVGALGPDELYEVATPGGAVNFIQPGLYQIGIDGDNTIISVLRGLARVVGLEGSGEIGEGQILTLVSATATQALSSSLAPELAGSLVDDYYRRRYPRTYDGRYLNYDAYLEDPSYYDPSRSSESYRYLPADIPGVYDLDYYGDWADVDGYGYCWAPRVSAGWAPFRHGSWDLDPLWGPTWVSQEAWGWAPYHYGRWAFVNQRWFWVPVEVVRRPSYCPAPVAFIPLAQTEHIAWVPLAPGEVFVPRYYDANFQPQYLASREVIREVAVHRTFVNLNAPSAVTVVPVQSMTRVIDPGVIVQVDSKAVANNQPALDPFAVEGIRRLAVRNDGARRRIKLARLEQEASNRTVVTGATPQSNIAKAFRVEQAPEARKKNKLKIDNTGQVVSARRTDGLPKPLPQPTVAAQANERAKQMADLATRANQGDKSARRQLRQFKREEQRAGRKQANKNQQAPQPPPVRQQVQQEQSRRQQKEQFRLQRRQQSDATQHKAARQTQQQQMEQKRIERGQQLRQQQMKQANERARILRSQQEAARRQQKEQRRIERKPPAPAVQPPQRMEALRQQQMKRANEQTRIPRSQQEAAREQQLKSQRSVERRQQQVIEVQKSRAAQQARQAQTHQPLKAQRNVEQKRATKPRN